MREKEKEAVRGILLAVTVAVALWSVGCSNSPPNPSEAPVQEMSDARQAIEAARMAGSPHYTPERFQEAQDLMEQAMLSLYQGEYGKARHAALSARARAIAARKAALDVQRME